MLGRTDAVVATEPTTLTLDASGLAPWATGDGLVADSWGNGTELYDFDQQMAPQLAVGATSTASSFNWSYGNYLDDENHETYSFGPGGLPFLMNPSEGDALVVSHTSEATLASGVVVATLTQVMNAPGVAQTDGGSATVTGAFADVAPSASIALSADLDEFATAFGSSPGAYVGVSLLTSPVAQFESMAGPELLTVTESNDTGTLSGSLALTEPYGDPFDPSWPVLVSSYFSKTRVITLPGAKFDLTLPFGCGEIVNAAPADYAFHPTAGVTAPTVNGIPFAERYVAWDGSSPVTLAFALPAGVNGFSLGLTKIYNDGGNVAGPVNTYVYANDAGSSITLPPELFESGNYYTMEVYTSTTSATGTQSTQTAAGKILIGPQAASTCGDGVVDPTIGETCDDGNHGGCSSSCR